MKKNNSEFDNIDRLLDSWIHDCDYRTDSFGELLEGLQDIALRDAIAAFSFTINELQEATARFDRHSANFHPGYLMWFFHQVVLDVYNSEKQTITEYASKPPELSDQEKYELIVSTQELMSITDKLIGKDDTGILIDRYRSIYGKLAKLGVLG